MGEQGRSGCGRGATSGSLTHREIEVLQVVANDGTAGAAATRLYCSVRTVEVHLSNIRRKLGLPTTVQCVARGYREGRLQ